MNGLFHKKIPKQPVNDHLKLIGRVLDSAVCTICHDYMFVPVMTSCGHNYCYECLSNWLNNNSTTLSELTCPQCRGKIKHEPSLNVSLQQLVDLMLELAENGPESNSHELRSLKEARDIAIAEYKSDLLKENLYRSIFKNTAEAIVDEDDDGIARCSNCHWELEGPICPNCNAHIRNYTEGAQNVDEIDPDEYSEGELDEVQRDVDSYRTHRLDLHDLEAEEDTYLSDESERPWHVQTRPLYAHGAQSLGTEGEEGQEEEGYEDDRGSIDSFIVDEEEEDRSRSSSSDFEASQSRNVAINLDSGDESKDSDFYEHNDDGYASGDSLDDSTSNDELEPREQAPARKKRMIVIDSDE